MSASLITNVVLIYVAVTFGLHAAEPNLVLIIRQYIKAWHYDISLNAYVLSTEVPR